MATYLLLWNPKLFPTQSLLDEMEQNRQKGSSAVRWNVASGQLRPGDRTFMMRVGSRRGIIGAGWVKSSPVRQPNWDPAKAAEGKTQLFVDVVFEQLAEDPLITLAELKTPPFAAFRWTPQGSGLAIPAELAAELEHRWARFASSDTAWLTLRQ